MTKIQITIHNKDDCYAVRLYIYTLVKEVLIFHKLLFDLY